MKIEELKTLIKGKDLNSEDAQQEIVDAINSDINSVVKRKKESVAEELEGYKAKVAEANLNAKKAEATIKGLTDQLSEKDAVINKTNTKLYISKKSTTNLTEQAIDDIIYLASKRVSKDKTNEQAIDELLSQYDFNKQATVESKKEQPQNTKVEQKLKSQPIPKNAYPVGNQNTPVNDFLSRFKSNLHIGSLSKTKKEG